MATYKQCMHVTKEMDIPQFACSYTAAPFFITELPFLICVNVELTHSPAPTIFFCDTPRTQYTRLNLSTMATLGTEESGLCRGVPV